MGRALVVAAAVVVVVALVGFFALRALRHSTRDHRRVRAERDAAVRSLRAVEDAARRYRDYQDPDSILAQSVVGEVERFDAEKRRLEST